MSLSIILQIVFHDLLCVNVGQENEVLILHTLFWIIDEIAERHEIDVVYWFCRNEEICEAKPDLVIYRFLDSIEVLHDDRGIDTVTVLDDED